MPGTNYDHVIAAIKSMPVNEQLRLLEQTVSIIRSRTGDGRHRSILELKGKELWENIDVKAYLDEERSSWNG